jgi:hypothetical protein
MKRKQNNVVRHRNGFSLVEVLVQPGGPWTGPVSVTPEGPKLRVTLDDPGIFRFFRLTAIPAG